MTHWPERIAYKLRNKQDTKMVVETAKQKTNELTDGRAKKPKPLHTKEGLDGETANVCATEDSEELPAQAASSISFRQNKFRCLSLQK